MKSTMTIKQLQCNMEMKSSHDDASDEDPFQYDEEESITSVSSAENDIGPTKFWRRRSPNTNETIGTSDSVHLLLKSTVMIKQLQCNMEIKSSHDDASEEDPSQCDEEESITSASSEENDIGPTKFWRRRSPNTNETTGTLDAVHPLQSSTRSIRHPPPFWMYLPCTTLQKVTKPIIHDDKIVKSCLKVKTNRESLQRPYFQRQGRRQEESKDRKLSFSNVEIREYEIILSDNPFVSSGPGIGLGWLYDQTDQPYQVNEYEKLHPPRRNRNEFKIPRDIREKMLLEEWNVSPEEISKATRQINASKYRRYWSAFFSQWRAS